MNGAGVYVHLPFCVTRCAYCDFAIHLTTDAAVQARYYDAVLREWALRDPGPGSIVSIYFGGGTPSLAPPAAIARIIAAVTERVAVAVDAEVTLEANPGTVSDATLDGYRRAGVNRLSIGVQAAESRILQAMNRPHDFSQAVAAVAGARAAGIDNVNLDAMYGYPGQTLTDVERTVQALVELEPEHLSLYQLQLEKGTVLRREVSRGRAVMPDEDLTADMAERAAQIAEAAGLHRYEVSNFARPGRASRHNRLYWNQAPYVGLGMGAHSFDGRRRAWNVRSLSGYLARLEAGQLPELGGEDLSRDELMSEFVWLGLRQVDGIAAADFRRRFGVTLESRFGAVMESLSRAGLIAAECGRLFLSARGFEVMNQILPEFLPDSAEALS